VRLADSDRADALQLALLDEIRRAGADDRHALVIMPPAEPDSATWRREYAYTLLELLAEHDHELQAPRRILRVLSEEYWTLWDVSCLIQTRCRPL
jgi:hypothetical protein